MQEITRKERERENADMIIDYDIGDSFSRRFRVETEKRRIRNIFT